MGLDRVGNELRAIATRDWDRSARLGQRESRRADGNNTWLRGLKLRSRIDYNTRFMIGVLSSTGPSGVDHCPGFRFTQDVFSESVGGESGHDASKLLHSAS
eukprot:2912040-Rhodomonas_salina.3